MAKLNPENPQHQAVRNLLRTVGPIVFGVGLVFLIVGVVSFFSAFGGMGPPRFFWCAFVGMPLMFVGGVMCQYGFLGAWARYMASEAAPVATDTFNYVADETRDGVKTIAGAVGEGLRDGLGANTATSEKTCPKCGVKNSADSHFCKACGANLT